MPVVRSAYPGPVSVGGEDLMVSLVVISRVF